MPQATTPQTGDLEFKKMLGSTDHLRITQGFIQDFFGLHVRLDQIEIAAPYSINRYHDILATGDAQQSRDLRETLRDVTIRVGLADLTLELQIRKETNFAKRALFYLANLYTSNYDRDPIAGRYASLRPVWQLCILGHRMFACPHGFHMFCLYDREAEEALDPELMRLGFLELHKPDTDPARARWQRLLLTGQSADGDPSYLQEAASIIGQANLSPKEHAVISLMEQYEAIREDEMMAARDDGIRETQLANARAALRWGVPASGVVEITGLDAATVDQLAAELH